MQKSLKTGNDKGDKASMIFHPAAAYGIALAAVLLLTICGVRNRRAGYQRERHDLIAENLALWQSFQQPEEALASSRAPLPVAAFQDKTSYHALQLNQLQIALAAAGTPPVRPATASASTSFNEAAETKDGVRVS